MEVNSKFLDVLKKIGELDVVEEVRNTLVNDIKELRDKVFNDIADTPKESIKENDNVNHPAHYTKGGIECIDAMEAAYGTEAVMHFCQCNAFKYQWRFDKKNGEEDIKKAQWYQNRYIELTKKLQNKDI